MKYFVICFIFICHSFLFAQEKVLIATGEFPPFTNSKNAHNGFMNHLITEAFKTQNIHTEFVYLPWKRAYAEAKQGLFMASSYWASTKERKKDFFFSEPIYKHKNVFFHLKELSFRPWKSWEELLAYRIGATKSYAISQEFLNAEKEGVINVERVNNDIIGLRQLFQKRIELFALSRDTGLTLLRQHFTKEQQKQVVFSKQAIAEVRVSLVFSKAHPQAKEYLKRFNRGLETIHQNGIFAELEEAFQAGIYE